MIAGDREAWCFVKGADEIGTSKKSKIYDFGEVLTRNSEQIVGADKRLYLPTKHLIVRAVDNVTGGNLTVTVKTANTLSSENLGSDAKEIGKYVIPSADLIGGNTLINSIIDHSMTKRYLQVEFTGTSALTGKIFAEVTSDAQ